MKFLRSFKLPLKTADGTPEEGELWYRTDVEQVRAQMAGDSIVLSNGPILPRFTDNYWYPTQPGSNTTSAIVDERMYASPFWPPKKCTLNGVCFEIATAATTGTARMTVYRDNGFLEPGARLYAHATTVSITTTGVKTFTGFTQTLDPVPYWIVICCQGVTGSPQGRTPSGAQQWIGDGSATPNLNTTQNAYYGTGGSGALPDPFGVTTNVGAGPRVSVRLLN